MTRFNHLHVPDQWRTYFTRYPQGYTILEALFQWIKQVDDMVDNQNELNKTVEDYRVELDDFVAQFNTNLQGTVEDTLSEWQQSGFLDVVIDQALQTQMDNLEDRVDDSLNSFNQQLAQVENFKEYRVNARNPLVTPTYDGSFQAMHPKVLYFSQAWSGYRYWMAMTPYTNTNDKTENPSILVSDYGYEWFEPTGIDNPISGIPNPNGYGHYSDTDLVMVNNVLECWYRYNPPNTGDTANDNLTNIVYRQTSTDGINWSPKEIVLESSNDTENPFMSPSLIYEANKYKIWWQDYNGRTWYQESTSGDINTWSDKQLIDIPDVEGYTQWHGDITRQVTNYEMLMCYSVDGQSSRRELFYSKSVDGMKWDKPKRIITPTYGTNRQDNGEIYRSSLVRDVNGYYRIYYSARNVEDNRWHTFLTEGSSTDLLVGYDSSEFRDLVIRRNLVLQPYQNIKLGDGELYSNPINGRMYLSSERIEVQAVEGLQVTRVGEGETRLITQPQRSVLSGNIEQEISNREGKLILTKNGQGSVYFIIDDNNNTISLKRGSQGDTDKETGFLDIGGMYFTGTYGGMQDLEGAFRYNKTKKKMEFYNGTNWETIESV